MEASERLVAVVMEKGWEQVAAVLGIHRAQCAYLPVDARLWQSSIWKVLELSGSSAVVCQARLLESHHPSNHTWLRSIDIPVVAMDSSYLDKCTISALPDISRASSNDLAYLIYL